MKCRHWGYYGSPKPRQVDPRKPTEADIAANRRRYEGALSRDCSESRLEPCPKCGNRLGVRLVKAREFGGRTSRKQRGACDEAAGGCGQLGPKGWSATDAERAWNDPEWRAGVGNQGGSI